MCIIRWIVNLLTRARRARLEAEAAREHQRAERTEAARRRALGGW